MRMRCLNCSTTFPVGRLWCPKCVTWASMDAVFDEEDGMPKITVNGGPSNGAPVEDSRLPDLAVEETPVPVEVPDVFLAAQKLVELPVDEPVAKPARAVRK